MADLALQVFQEPRRPPAQVQFVRELESADLALLERPAPATIPSIKRIRDSHHALARALASGMKHIEAAAVCGFTPSRISVLLKDPQFAELLAFYRAEKDVQFSELHSRMATLSHMAAEELQERLEEKPETFENKELMKLIETTADRTGFGPKETRVNVNVELSARLEEARRRAGLLPTKEPVA